MSSLKEKLSKKNIFIIVIIITIIISAIIIINFNTSKNSSKVKSKSGLKDIYAIATTVSIKGNDNGVESFLELAENQSISFESEDMKNCLNITPDHISQNSEYQIFKFKDTAETYIICDNIIYKIGNNKRERGATSFALADINNDDKLELFYTYTWKVSDRTNSNVSYFDPEAKKEYGINKNYSDMNIVLVKNKEELCIYDATFSRDESYVDFNLNAKLEKDVIINENGVIKPMERVLFEDLFSNEKNK